MKWTLIFAGLIFMLWCCTNVDSLKRKEPNLDAIYSDYTIRGEEGDSNVTAYLQFKRGGPNGPALILDHPASVQLDTNLVRAGSAKLTGTYYEIQKPLNGFIGKHNIIFTDFDEKQHKEEFQFRRFNLKKEIPRFVERKDLTIDFLGLDPGDKIRISATDTSFTSKDIVEIDTVKNGRLVIPAEKLKNLVNGPVILLLSRETERPIKNGTKAGGRIVVSYGIKRQFELRDR